MTALLLCVLLPARLAAQNVQHSKNSQDLGLRHDFSVDPVSLSLNLQVTLGAYKGRGGSVLPVSLQYSSKLWRLDFDEYVVGGPVGLPDDNNYTKLNAVYGDPNHDRMTPGWSSTLEMPYLINDPEWYDPFGMPCDFDKCRADEHGEIVAYYMNRVRLRMPDGSTHELRADDDSHFYTQQRAYPITYYAVDSSRLVYKVLGVVNGSEQSVTYLPDGSRYLSSNNGFTGSFVDRHGNTLTFDGTSWTDALGRSVSLGSLPGFNNTSIDYAFTYRSLKVQGHPEQSALTDYNQPLHYYGNGPDFLSNPALFAGGTSDTRINSGGIFNPSVLYQITAPDGGKYTFTYNVYGEIDKVVYPTGGYERFEYDAVEGVTAMNSPYTLTNRGVVRRWVSPDGTAASEQPWDYSSESVSSSVLKTTTVAPDGTVTDRYVHRGLLPGVKYFGLDDSKSGMVFEECVYAPGPQRGDRGALLRRYLKEWGREDYVKQGAGVAGGFHVTRNPRINKEVDVVLDAGITDAVTKVISSQYDADLNLISTSEYDYQHIARSSGQANVGQASAVNSYASGALLRTTESVFLVNDASVDPNVRAAYRARNLLSLPTSQVIKDGASNNIVSRSVTRYDETAYPVIACPGIAGWTDPQTFALGDATTSGILLNTNNAWVETHARYDQAGNLRESRDAHYETETAHGHVSEFVFTANYQYAYLEQARTPAPDPTGVNGSGSPLVTTNTYDPKTGLILTSEDANGRVSNFYYVDASNNVDPLSRLRKVTRPDGGWTSYDYDNTPNEYFARVRSSIDADHATDSYQFFDGLGRPSRSYSYDGSAADRTWVAARTTYDSMGRVSATSNPLFQTGLDDFTPPSNATTSMEYDELGRVKKVTSPDGAFVTNSYGGDSLTVTDQAGSQRRSVTDAMGRLKAVYEDPTGLNYATTYTYDALNNLKTVTQGAQTRTFVYDSLSRLKTAVNPESGTATYEYDPRGNLTQKIDARGVTTTYTYDALNRITSRDYSDSTPDAAYYYDTGYRDSQNVFHEVANALGHLTQASNSGFSYAYTSFDVSGRVAASAQQMTDGRVYQMSYVYNLAGELTSETYPSGKVVETGYDRAGRVASARNQATGTYYAGGAADGGNRIRYAPQGAVEAVRLGNGLWEHRLFNERLQPKEIGVGTTADDPATNGSVLRLVYGYETFGSGNISNHDNNGNVRSQTINVPGMTSALRQDYFYDTLNRVQSARESKVSGGAETWKQGYTYVDVAGQNGQFGNRRVDTSLTTQNVMPASNPTINPSNNRFDANQGYGYDASGNLTQDPQHSYAYDAENRIVSVDGGWNGTTGATYYYDGDGRRVKKVAASDTTNFIYDAAGRVVAEYSNQTAGSGTTYVSQDLLGSARVVTKQSGEVQSRHDYLPFGEEAGGTLTGSGRESVPSYNFGTVRRKFTGQERDAETGLDYFGMRYYASAQGRFTSPDPLTASAKITDPRTLNRYVYVVNNPLRYVDPDGLEGADPNNPWDQLSKAEQKLLASKFTDVKDAENPTAKELKAAGSAFSRMVGDAATVEIDGNRSVDLTKVASVVGAAKAFAAELGGNKAVWNQVDKIKSFNLTGDNQVADVAFTVKNRDAFVSAIKDDKNSSGYNRFVYIEDWDMGHKDSARSVGVSIDDPSFHVDNKGANFSAHWDKTSVITYPSASEVFKDALTAFGRRAIAGTEHYTGRATIQQVQTYLNREGLVPK